MVPDDGSGTADLPPDGCAYLNLSPLFIRDGLPPGTEIEIDAKLYSFFCLEGGVCGEPGGNLDGEREVFLADLLLQMNGTGELTGFERNIELPIQATTDSGPRTPGDAVQSFDTDLYYLAGALDPGDPDFDSLNVRVGVATGFGLPPSPGQTTLSRLGPPGSDFQIDSFFDIVYQIEFLGAPGGVLEGLAGTTQDSVRIEVFGHCGIVDVPSQVFPVEENVYGEEILSGGNLEIQADVAFLAHSAVALRNGFVANVASGQTLAMGADPTNECPPIP